MSFTFFFLTWPETLSRLLIEIRLETFAEPGRLKYRSLKDFTLSGVIIFPTKGRDSIDGRR